MKLIRMKFVPFTAFLACIVLIHFSNLSAAASEDKTPPSLAPPGQSKNIDAQDKLGGHLNLYGDVGGRINPQGLGFRGGINYRNVYRYDEKYQTEGAYWQAGLRLGTSPSYGQAGVHMEWMPWLFLKFRVSYDQLFYYGMDRSLLSFSSASAPFGDDDIKDRKDQESATGQRISFRPTLQAKIDRVVLRNQTDVVYYKFSGRGPYFLELSYYTLLKDGDWLISNQTEALYEVWKGLGGRTLLAGPFYQWTHADGSGISQQKTGLMFYWVPVDNLFGLDRPRVGLQVGYHLEDPNYRNQMFVVLGAGFDFDLKWR
jgi:hypothetical protein